MAEAKYRTELERLITGLSDLDLHDLVLELAEEDCERRETARSARLAAARTAALQGDLLLARREAEEAIHIDMTNPEVQTTLAEILEQLGDLDGAHTHYAFALEFGADAAEATCALERTALTRPDNRVATTARRYENGIDRAKAYLRERDLRRSEACVRAAIDADSTRAEGFNLLGVIREMAGDRVGAQRQYRIALELQPGYAPAAENLARSTGPREERSRPSW